MNERNSFTYHGTVHEVGKLQTFASGFKKRELVCRTQNGEYTDYAVFEAKKDLADRLATLHPGASVRVTFVLNAREWDGPKGKRWFGGATALKVEGAAVMDSPAAPAQEQQPEPDESDMSDIPF